MVQSVHHYPPISSQCVPLGYAPTSNQHLNHYFPSENHFTPPPHTDSFNSGRIPAKRSRELSRDYPNGPTEKVNLGPDEDGDDCMILGESSVNKRIMPNSHFLYPHTTFNSIPNQSDREMVRTTTGTPGKSLWAGMR